MDQELIGQLTEKVERLLAAYAALKDENRRLTAERDQLVATQQLAAARLDGLLARLAQVAEL